MKNILPKLLIGGSTAALMASLPGAVFAQDNDIEQVVVSASRITIAGYSQPTPVTVVGAAQLAQDAYADIQDSVRQLPQVNSPNATMGANQGGGNGQNGAQLINLRNLGLTRTLTLLDGQRIPIYQIQGGYDTAMFPSTLISRVDIVTGGASATWGSDAVAGVVNFVLDKNYNGFKATFMGSDTSDNLYRQVYGEAAWGGDIDGGRGHFEFSGSARINPDNVLMDQEKWWRNAYWVSNPAYAAGNGQPQMIVANNVAIATATQGGLITASPAGTTAAANALRGINFTGAGVPEVVNFGNLTQNTLSNGGSLSPMDGQWPWQQLGTPSNTYTLFAYGRYKLTDTIQASLMVNYGYFTGKGEQGDNQTTATIRSDNAYIPATIASAMTAGGITSFSLGGLYDGNTNNYTLNSKNFYQQAEAGMAPNISFNRRVNERAVFTLTGELGDDWSWNAYYEHGDNRNSIHMLGDTIKANMNNAIDAVTVTSANVGKTGLALGSIACRTTLTGAAFVSGGITASSGCIPLNSFGVGVASPAAIAYVNGYSNNLTEFADESFQQDVAEGSMQGVLPWALPAGKVAVAFGMGYRKEAALITTPAAQSAISTLGGYGEANINAFPDRSYNVLEGFGEVDAPILKNNVVNSLDVTMAGRMTSYSTSGLVETWKLGATSQVIDDIKLRTTWSVDIRAPILNELYNSTVATGVNETDPKTNITAPINKATVGNPNLLPEVARTISGGVVLTPTFIPGLSISADWYNINISNVITTVSDNVITSACNPLKTSPTTGQPGSMSDPLCANLVFGGPGGALSQVNQSQINLAHQRTSGLDAQANYVMDFWEGTLSWAGYANLNDENTLSSPLLGKPQDVAGNASYNIGNQGAPGPKWRGVVSATYNTGPWSMTVQSRWWGTMVQDAAGNTGQLATAATANQFDPNFYEVSAVAYLDLRANYKWNDNISFFGAVDNALDTPPPLRPSIGIGDASAGSALQLGSQFTQSIGAIYDMQGRTIRAGIRINY